MSLCRWPQTSQDSQSTSILPNVSNACTSSTNKEVSKTLDQESEKQMKRGSYTQYSNKTWAKIARYASEHGNKAAVNKFLHELGKPIPESTIRNMKSIYLQFYIIILILHIIEFKKC